jgi:hypothetical protein
MKNTQSDATAGADTPVSDNISFEELVAQRIGAHTESEDEEDRSDDLDGDDDLIEDDQDVDDVETNEDDQSEETEEESEELDLLNLTTEQIQELAKKGKSRLLHRVGELTAQKKALEEQLKSQLEAQPQYDPVPSEENPFREITTVDELKAQVKEMEKVAKDTDHILDEHEDYGLDDIIVIGDREFTKREIKKANRNARESLVKYLPAQQAELVKREQRVALEAHLGSLIPQEIPEFADEESSLVKQFNAMMADPLVAQVKQRVPDIAPQLAYLLAHAAKSMQRSAKTVNRAKTTEQSRSKVSGTPFGVGAAKSSPRSAKKAADQQYQKFQKSHSENDWIAARVARLS